MKKITKSDVYKSLIDVQKASGQGLSGIVKIQSGEYAKYLDELIEEGLVKCSETGGSLGHPESNNFYMPTSGYNVWEDDADTDIFKGKYLTHVRLYLGALGEIKSNDKRENLNKVLNPNFVDLVTDFEFMEDYVKWLKRNEKELEIMMNLSNFYVPKEIIFTEEETEFIQSREWYTDNKTINDCKIASMGYLERELERLSVLNQLKDLYLKTDSYEKEKAQNLIDIEEVEKERSFRNLLHNWFDAQDENNIKNII